MNTRLIFCVFLILCCVSCAKNRIKEKKEWGRYFEEYGIKDACFEMRDHNHEIINYYNLPRCSQRFTPASTFKIFNSLVALETAIAGDDQYLIRWDSVERRSEWDKDMTLNQAFKVSCVPCYQQIARKIGAIRMQHFLDTVKYGNANMSGRIDEFWLNDSLKISPDEQLGFLKKLYFGELPMSERSQRIVKVMMLQEQNPEYNLYYKTGTTIRLDKHVYWVVGFAERIEHVKEPKESMNKSDVRYYPYFFVENFEAPANADKDWNKIRLSILDSVLKEQDIIPK